MVASCSTCSGGEKAGFVGSGGTLTFNGVTAAAAGANQVTIAYLDGSATGRQAMISVNGGTPQTVSFTPAANNALQPIPGLITSPSTNWCSSSRAPTCRAVYASFMSRGSILARPFGVGRSWTRADCLGYAALVATVGGGLLAASTQVSGAWGKAFLVTGIVLVVAAIPVGTFLLLRIRAPRGASGDGGPGTQEDGGGRGDLDTAIEEGKKASKQLEDDLYGDSSAPG